MAGAELEGNTVEAKMLEVEQASLNVEAQARLEELRSQMGLGASTAPAAEPQVATEGGGEAPAAG